MHIFQNRRRFLAGLAAGAAGLVAAPARALAEPPPETTSVRLPVWPTAVDCFSPIYIARELLHAEGLTDVSFVASGIGPDSGDWFQHGEIDFDWNYPPAHVLKIAKGVPIKVLSGVHIGWIANDKVGAVPDLKVKKVGIDAPNSISYLLLDIMTAYMFFVLRMREAGFTKSTPEQIIAKGTDIHFLDELKRELKT